MKTSQFLLLTTVMGLAFSSAVMADRAADKQAEAQSVTAVEGASIAILSPVEGAHVDANEEYPLAYEVALGKGGDHFHVWVDDKRGPGVHDNKGSYTIPKLTPGEHVISLQIVDKGHVGTGPKQSIIVYADADSN